MKSSDAGAPPVAFPANYSDPGPKVTAPVNPKRSTPVVLASFGTPIGKDIFSRSAKQQGSRSSLVVACESPIGSAFTQPSPDRVIDLGDALRLAGVDNPTIELAQERVREALAGQLAARSLLVPSVNIGGNYYLHHGALQSSGGFLRTPNSQSLYLGSGPGPIGPGAVTTPGVWLFAHLGDAVYEPLVARQRVVTRQSEAQGVRNAVLFDVASAYLQLAGAEARLDLLRRAESDVAEIVRITSAFAKGGEGNPADANRAAANAELVRRDVREAEGSVATASARLSRLLTLDPSTRLHSLARAVEPFRLVSEDADLDSLVTVAIQSRPELAARAAAIQEARTVVRQERVRPWLPLLVIGYTSGAFGGGSNLVADEFGPMKGRADLDVMAVWNIQNLGVGNHARVSRARAVVGQAVADHGTALNQVRREVAEAQAAAKTAARQIETAKVALAAAEEGYRLETDRIKLGEGRPIEGLDSFRQLLEARQELVRAIIAFDIAQVQLFVALGSNPEAGSQLECGAGTTTSWLPSQEAEP